MPQHASQRSGTSWIRQLLIATVPALITGAFSYQTALMQTNKTAEVSYETLARAVDDLGATATAHHDELVTIKAYIEELEAQLPDETVAKETLPRFQALPPKTTVRIPPNLDQAIRLKKQQR